jgi:hypothetical protein
MLDFDVSADEADKVSPEDTAQNAFMQIIGGMSDAELAALEDELNFYLFAGLPSHRILAIMDRAGILNPEWRKILQSEAVQSLPSIR